MSDIGFYLVKIIEYIVIIIVCISFLSFFLYQISAKYNIKYINFYGFLSSMDNSSLFLLSSLLLKEITLIFCIIRLNGFSNVYLTMFLIYGFLFSLFTFNVKSFIKKFSITGIQYLIIFFLSLLTSFLSDIKFEWQVLYCIILFSLVLFVSSLFFFIKDLQLIISKDENVRRNLLVK